MTRKSRRLYMVLLGLLCLGGATALVLTAFQENLLFFVTPAQVQAGEAPRDRSFRLGGLVEEGSVQRQDDGKTIEFRITDTDNSVSVRYAGILPDLFREGQGVVTEGRLDPNGVFLASEVLAKHDENYMPAEVADALKAEGYWQEGADGADAQ